MGVEFSLCKLPTSVKTYWSKIYFMTRFRFKYLFLNKKRKHNSQEFITKNVHFQISTQEASSFIYTTNPIENFNSSIRRATNKQNLLSYTRFFAKDSISCCRKHSQKIDNANRKLTNYLSLRYPFIMRIGWVNTYKNDVKKEKRQVYTKKLTKPKIISIHVEKEKKIIEFF